MIAAALRWMLQPDAPLYIRPRVDPAAVALAAAASPRAATCATGERSARAKAALLNDSRVRLARLDPRLRAGLRIRRSRRGLRVPRSRARMAHELRASCRCCAISASQVEVIDGRRIRSAGAGAEARRRRRDPFRGRCRAAPGSLRRRTRARVAREGRRRSSKDCALQAIERDGDGVGACARRTGTYRARDVVLALGAWSPRLADAIGLTGLRGAMQPGKGYSITYDRAGAACRSVRSCCASAQVCVTAWGERLPPRQHDGILRLRRHASTRAASRRWNAAPPNTCTNPSAPIVRERWFGWRPMTCDDIPLIGRVPRPRRPVARDRPRHDGRRHERRAPANCSPT